MNLPRTLLILGSLLGGSTSGDPTPTPRRDDAASCVREQLGIDLAVAQSRVRRSITSTSTPYGFLIARVRAGSPAERAGLRAGDVLLEWDGAPIGEVEELADHARRLRADGAALRYARKRPNVPLTFPATDPWETRRTRVRPPAAVLPPRRPI
jgi:S1-C subfamily serine protease